MAKTASPPPTGKVLVTGGSGHLGSNLVRRLLDDGHEVRCLVQPNANNKGLDGLEVERVPGDIRSFEDVRQATRGCARVFHIAAKISTYNASAEEEREVFDINVTGTRHVMQASLRNDVGRVVLTGSFSATGYDLADPSQPSAPEQPFYPFEDWLPYTRSKVLAEHETLKAVVDGLDAVIATSCSVIGPHDFVPSRMGSTMCDFANGKLRAYVPGGFSFIAARDIAEGHVLAMEKGRTGQKYLFASSYLSMDDIVQIFAEIVGRPPPRLRIPAGVMASMTNVYYGIMSRYFPASRQRLTPAAIKILRMHRHVDISKSQTELGFEPTDIRAAFRDAFEFFAKEGKIKGPLALDRAPSSSRTAVSPEPDPS